MHIHRVDPLRDEKGRILTYSERLALHQKRADEIKAKNALPKPERSGFYSQSYEARQAAREAEARARKQAEAAREAAERAGAKVAQEMLPPHEREFENPFRRLIAALKPDAYKPDVARRIALYEQRAAERDAQNEAERARLLKQYLRDQDPEYQAATKHFESASEAAETPEEKIEWAKARGYLTADTGMYYKLAGQILENRLARIRERQTAEREAAEQSLQRQQLIDAEEAAAAKLQSEVPNEQ